ncbi:MAG: DNA polymerase II [Treponema sp.]|nr:DNA polymerase II [Treponema sp.]
MDDGQDRGLKAVFRGFLVHAYAQAVRRTGSRPGSGAGRIFLLGRLEDGRSFAAAVRLSSAGFHISGGDLPRSAALLSSLHYRSLPPRLQDFSGKGELVFLDFDSLADRGLAFRILSNAGIPSPDGAEKPAESFLMERQIRGRLEIQGQSRPGRYVDLVFADPRISAPSPAGHTPEIPLRVASVDIETDTRPGPGEGAILAIGVAWADARHLDKPGDDPPGGPGEDSGFPRRPAGGRRVRVLGTPPDPAPPPADQGPRVMFHPGEAALLRAFLADIRSIDPDVLTGWNFLDFDFKQIAQRCALHHIPLSLGRSDDDEAKYFPPGNKGRSGSAAALVPGRQVVDALRVFRAGGRGFLTNQGGLANQVGLAETDGSPDSSSGQFSLEAVSRQVLGEGKLVSASGEEKLAELVRLYTEDPEQFARYCLRDAELVLRILERTGLFRLTVERAGLTAVSLDKAWTSVVSFERIYGMELRRLGIAPPFPNPDQNVSGAAGGTVLESPAGLFNNIAVFDFRSLYPTIMLTFNIDPLCHARAPAADPLTAPNGAAFSREPGPLPGLIAGYFAERRNALGRGNETAAQVYKILMNSFYGVLGTQSCRYGRTELAGAITSFAKKWLYFSRDWFRDRGFRVLYGDTDSLFVETSVADDGGYEDFNRLCGDLAAGLNRDLGERIREEYGCRSFIELRFEKAYRRLLLPPLRHRTEDESSGEAPGGTQGKTVLRGRAKGYGGYLITAEGGGLAVEVKGMEAVRSDVTALARRLQLELLELVFSGEGEDAFRRKLRKTLADLEAGKLDAELVYRKRLSRPPESYTASTPPQVKAARALGWKGRRGTVAYVWTGVGAEPLSLPHQPLDYRHYAQAQVLPVAKSIADAVEWNIGDLFPVKGRKQGGGNPDCGQMELEFNG